MGKGWHMCNWEKQQNNYLKLYDCLCYYHSKLLLVESRHCTFALTDVKNHLCVHPMFLHSNATSHKWAFGGMFSIHVFLFSVCWAVHPLQSLASFLSCFICSHSRAAWQCIWWGKLLNDCLLHVSAFSWKIFDFGRRLSDTLAFIYAH